jgi:prephenate dehydratase
MTRVAIQGIRGSYSEEAATSMFGGSVELVECPDFASTFREAESGDALVLVPVRNSIVGDIASTNSLLRSSGLRVYEEIELRIDHILAGAGPIPVERVRTVRSHPEALKQCNRFLASRPQISVETCTDTATGIRDIAAFGRQDEAAIGSRNAAELYGACILHENIADSAENRTLFYLLGK